MTTPGRPEEAYRAPDSESLAQQCNRLIGQLESERATHIGTWQDVNDFIKPRRGRFFVDDVNKGDRRTNKIIDSTATFAADTLSAGMMAGLTSQARPWFQLETPDPDLNKFPAVKRWLADVQRRMLAVFAQSNVYDKLAVMYGDMGIFGTAAVGIFEDDETVIRCYDFPVGSFCIGNDERQKVAVFTRKFKMTVRQVVRKFGERDAQGRVLNWQNFSEKTKAAWLNRQLESWVSVVHVIQPNMDAQPGMLDSKFLPWRDTYYEFGVNDRVLRDKGYHEWPLMTPRWDVTGEDAYATGCPGINTLGDIKALQIGEKQEAKAIEKMITPPLVGSTQLQNRVVSLLPANITYEDVTAQRTGLRPIHEVNPRILEASNAQDRKRMRVQKGFYEDLFLMLSTSDRRDFTATEIAERKEEKLLALGPVVGRIGPDALGPLIDRTFSVMLRKGLIPPAPEEMSGMALNVVYISIMAIAQKMIGIASLDRFTLSMVQVATAMPEAVDKINTDELVDTYADMTGIPPAIVRSADEVAAIREARAQTQQAAANATTLKDASSAAKNLSESDTEGDNALTRLLGMAAGAGA